MAKKTIRTKIKCENLAPFSYMEKELNTSMLRIGIFANNGSGKTFLSRMFRLLESPISSAEDGSISTDYLIRFGCNHAKFSFTISDESGIKEDINLDIHSASSPVVPSTFYIYHTFTHDYVEENIRALNFEKESNITGYILGKANIDLSDEENHLKQILTKGNLLKTEIISWFNAFMQEKINTINLSRLTEYRTYLNIDYILNSDKNRIIPSIKLFDSIIEDYNKVKAIPENLDDIPLIQIPEIDIQLCEDIIKILETEYSVSSIAEDFKTSIRKKETLVEAGLKLFNPKENCPFCGQTYDDTAIKLINQYVTYFNDVETKTTKLITARIEKLNNILSNLDVLHRIFESQRTLFDNYKNKYIPSFGNEELLEININGISEAIKHLCTLLEDKIKAINTPINVDNNFLPQIEQSKDSLISIIKSNNTLVERINYRKSKIADENIKIRREICCSAYNHIATCLKDKILERKQLLEEYKQLDLTIKQKKEKEKVGKKEKVAETIRRVLDYFFAGKYTLNGDNFQLVFNSKELAKGQTSKVLSEGEKSIVAFAYYLGDTHIKINREDDYARLFFIIDDPISSMDFSYVYSLCGVIREIHNIIPNIGNRYRYIIFTHNNDFMRILNENNIISTALLLSNNKLEEFNTNFSVPYISHLMDIYRIAHKGGIPSHTTANSIRHIIETLTKFDSISVSEDSIAEYIRRNIPNDKKTYTLINDLSHGGWRSEQAPITQNDYKDICKVIIKHIHERFPRRIEYCMSAIK